MTYQKTVAQVFGRPMDTDRTKSLQGDIYDVTGHINIGDAAIVHYSFKGPALVGQAGLAIATPLPSTVGMIDINFPCRFTEKPVFTFGFEYGKSATTLTIPLVVGISSWILGARDETGFPFYDGARVSVK